MSWEEKLQYHFDGARILVTGAAGTIGEEIVSQLLAKRPLQVRVFDNRETELYYLRTK